MFRTLRGRIFLNGLAILILGMGIAGFFFWRAAEAMYLQTEAENHLAQAELTAAAYNNQPLPAVPAESYSQVSNVMPGIHTRLLGTEGTVLIGLPLASDSPAVQMPPAEGNVLITPDELSKRPEIQSARNGIAATFVRTVTAGNRRVLYAAAPIRDDSGEVSGLAYLAMPLPGNGLPAGFTLQLVGAGLIAVILALAVGFLLARQITTPVSALAKGAANVSHGDLTQTVSVNSQIDELDNLADTFNYMVASLQKSNQAQNAFVADVAHELRTPLTVIKGTIETLEDGAMDDLVGRGPLLESMQKETDRLIRLVNNLLVLTRADAGMLKLHVQSLNLTDLVRQRCDRLLPLAIGRNITFDIQSANHSLVRADEDRLAQVLDNLLDNAIRYSAEGGMIIITITPDGSNWCCAVSDSGPGIPPEHLPFIFDRFYRVETSRRRQGGEAGLGLSIARSLIQAQGGLILAENTPGGGATFVIRLPASDDCPEAAGLLTSN